MPTIPAVEETSIELNKDGLVEIRQRDRLSGDDSVVQLHPLMVPTFIEHVEDVVEGGRDLSPRKKGTCEICGIRDPFAGLHLVWSRGRGGEDVDSFGLEICKPCSGEVIKRWERMCLSLSRPEIEDEKAAD
jgi:hypothetical protein